jgi:hypothetical protein
MQYDREMAVLVSEILDGSLGLDIFPRFKSKGSRAKLPKNPYLAGLVMFLLYEILFNGPPLIFHFFNKPDANQPSWALFVLQIYGGAWAAWATSTTRITSHSVEKKMRDDIIPNLSNETSDRIGKKLKKRFGRERLLVQAWTVAVISATAAALLVAHDLASVSNPSLTEIIWWAAGWSILFATSTKVVTVSSFYLSFAEHLNDEPEILCGPDAGHSTLIVSVAAVAKDIMFFWFGIALSIAAVIPFNVKSDK